MSEMLAKTYSAKAEDCLREAAKALSQSEKERWLKLAGHWSALALETNPSGALPWEVVH
ncbi:MAG: hypothetical protein QOF09_4272 [Alphaproteobacteria bacterium]|jgi:hypothetical protein|nr:hypothetical protein [Alphaproteobacteria bacterium]